ncbi:MAG TPA: ABC transporter permease [Bryobacteraceae bacterium]|nr:ABC transporter permease [Bryobacteraceae bacterium]
MGSVWRDLKYGLRTLVRSPGFTIVAVISLALGIGANTAIFTLTNAVFLNPLPVTDPSRVLEVFTVDHATTTTLANLQRTPMSFLNYKDFRDQSNVFDGVAAYIFTGLTLTGRGDPKPETGMLVSANYFDVLGVKPAMGRTFFRDEDRADGGNTVTVLSYSLWVQLFGADPSAIGKTVEFNSIPYTVVGIMPPEFKGTQTLVNPELAWIPMSMHAQALPGQLEALFNERRMRMINVFGRLKPGMGEAQALSQLQAIAANLEREYPRANRGRSVEVSSLAEAALGFLPRNQLVTAGIALSAVVALVLLIACVNLANLQLARAARRTREMAVRTAVGAERGRLVRQLLTESLVISLAGGVAGLVLGWGGSQLLWSFRPAGLGQNSLPVSLDWRVFLFTAGMTVFTGILFGLAPALRTSMSNLAEVLKSGGRGGNEAFARNRLRSVLVICEVSLALISLTGAGLLIRSMDAVQKINPGFETHNLFVVNFDTSPQHFAPEKGVEFLHSVLEKAKSVPGVRSVALANSRPLTGGLLATLLAEGQESDPNQRGTLTLTVSVSPAYFDTMRIPLLEGRGFTDFDRQGSKHVAIVSEAMARHFWPGQSAIGKRFHYAVDNDYREVVGVCANTATVTIGEQPQPVAYAPIDQYFSALAVLHVRTDGNPEAVMPSVIRQVQSLNSNMALTNPNTVQELIALGLWAPRVAAALFGIFGLLGLVLASVGIYGVMAYMVAQRTNEIGLRMALGARPADVSRLVVGQGMRMVGIGIAFGIASGLAVTRLMANLLFNVPTYDPISFGAVSLLVAFVAFIAGWIPARRASHIDPVLALRQE